MFVNNSGKSSLVPSILKDMKDFTLVKNYGCKQYGKAFTDPTKFQRHVIISTEEKYYMYKQCGKVFTYISNLSRLEKFNWRGTIWMQTMWESLHLFLIL
jgi:hypothetical protein